MLDQSTITVLLTILVAVAIFGLFAGVFLVVRGRREAELARKRALEGQGAQEAGGESKARLVGAVNNVGEIVSGGRFSKKLGIELTNAGFHHSSAPAVFLGAKVLLFVLGGALTLLGIWSFGIPIGAKFAIGVVIGSVLFFIPNIVLAMRRSKRANEVQDQLPDAIDLLDICVSSGMGLEMAWIAVADEIRNVSELLSDEMELTSLEISLGVTRAEAMRHMADRTGSQDISSLVALLVQAERFGASIVDALKMFAKSMREGRSARAEEAAEKMAVKLLFPMTLFIFPTLLIIMVGPALMEVLRVLQ